MYIEANRMELNNVVAGLYNDLHRLAARRLRSERAGHTLQATALVHEVYLKLCDQLNLEFAGATHFFAIASRVMRQVLVDHARARSSKKRGGAGGGEPSAIPLSADIDVAGDDGRAQADLLELDRALDALSREDESLAQLIEMRYFGGMTAEETAEALRMSVHVVRHNLRLAQAWLRRELCQGPVC